MSRVIIISNRLPITLSRDSRGLHYSKSIGGLATGLKSILAEKGTIWLGWPGIAAEKLSQEERGQISERLLRRYKCIPVYLTEEEIEGYYYGFSNRTIWPLFHYFQADAEYDKKSFEAYRSVNAVFAKAVADCIKPGDIIWIHDYQLMLLPQMIREAFPENKIGFFLHIPFPSYEVFRLLVWRKEILLGLLGADLIGFHTFDYVRHFLSCVSRLIGADSSFSYINYDGRIIRADALPMGIDYARFARPMIKLPKTHQLKILRQTGLRQILSVDRLDYTKGIPQRILGYDCFLKSHPEYLGKVRLNLIVAPSREKVRSYASLLKKIAQLVSDVNGHYGTFSWMPIWYHYRTFSQDDLILLYKATDVLLDTPLRDGMNLVCKEYLAARNDCLGMAVLSETAGAAQELREAVIVNPNDIDAIAEGIYKALSMSDAEKKAKDKIMRQELERFDVEYWARSFLGELQDDACSHMLKYMSDEEISLIRKKYDASSQRVIFLDYDGTLLPFSSAPAAAVPDNELLKLIARLSADARNEIAVCSGRDKLFLENSFKGLNISLIASHGFFVRQKGRKWESLLDLSEENDSWMPEIMSLLETFTYRIPNSVIERKEHALAWHYRLCDQSIVSSKYDEILLALNSSVSRFGNLQIMEGNKVLEIKDRRISKGRAALRLLEREKPDFVLGAGDDYTDEDLFGAIEGRGISIKIGNGKTIARYRLKSYREMRRLLSLLAAGGGNQ